VPMPLTPEVLTANSQVVARLGGIGTAPFSHFAHFVAPWKRWVHVREFAGESRR